MNKLIFSVFPLFSLLLFSSCFSPSEPQIPKVDYIISIQGFNLPLTMKKGVPYNIPVRIYLGDQSINWTLCLASFKHPVFNITGSECESKEYDAEVYEIYLPKGGSIKLEHPEYLLSKTVDIIINACYNYYNVFSLDGCVSKEKVCSLNLTGVLPKVYHIEIKRAEVVYDGSKYYLRIYIFLPIRENFFIGSKNNDISKCYIEYFSADKHKVSYILKYREKSVSGEALLTPGATNQIDVDLSGLGITYDLVVAHFDFRIDYTVLQRIYLGSVRIEE